MTHTAAALIIGAGNATGDAIVRKFAKAGYTACVTRRSADKLQILKQKIESDGALCHAFASDARKEEEVLALADQIESTVGPIDTALIRDNFPERYALKAQDGILKPEHIADAYLMLHQPPRDAWTHEQDLPPYMEKF
ncbi:MAG: SDR family NAD(P)-dependent oxidoreductase [Betaproteobacteria bacterium]|nr:SDR family NAD(P)-dependent oxidoreductase [Betaproteobacteria bacterium]MBK7654797.1 SDR family NAD(P)-dependent oxidoreductase [Betaproteobacteria bacterium]